MKNRLAIVMVIGLCGCAGNTPPGGAAGASAGTGGAAAPAGLQPSGFLVDYSRLQPSPYHADTKFEQSPKLAGYGKFIVDPVVMLARQVEGRVGGAGVDAATAANLTRAAREEVTNSLRVNNEIVDQAGPGVARIKAAITKLGAPSDPLADPVLKGRINAASVEIEIVDSVSGERLGAAIENDQVKSGDLYDSGPDGQSGELDLARLVFTHWAARLNLWLERAKRGE